MNTATNPLRCKSALNEDDRNDDYRDEAQIDEDQRDTRPQLLKNTSDEAQIYAVQIAWRTLLLKDISDNNYSCTKHTSSKISATQT